MGRDLRGYLWQDLPKKFQSTRPRGARQSVSCLNLKTLSVSIHAPAWGATNDYLNNRSDIPRFNPRARVGRDIIFCSIHYRIIGFNPRARVGRDSPSILPPGVSKWFHPRARVGRDVRSFPTLGSERFGFNPRARVGRDISVYPGKVFPLGFNPRARVGRDSYCKKIRSK